MRIRAEWISNAITIAAGVMILVVGGARLTSGMRFGTNQPAASTLGIETLPGIEVPVTHATVKGHATARLALVEFSDFQCTFCGRYARETFPQIIRDYVDTGIAQYVFFNYPIGQIHPLAFRAGEAAECSAEQGQYWNMHAVLFDHQQALEQPQLVTYARTIGLAVPDFERCLSGNMRSRIDEHVAAGQRLGVRGTPTFLVGRVSPDGRVRAFLRFTGAQSYAFFKAALSESILN